MVSNRRVELGVGADLSALVQAISGATGAIADKSAPTYDHHLRTAGDLEGESGA
jgi:hypothetical protein